MTSVQSDEIVNCNSTTSLGEENPDTGETDVGVSNLRESASDLQDRMKEDTHKANDDTSEEVIVDQTIQLIVDDPVEQSTNDFTNSLEKTDFSHHYNQENMRSHLRSCLLARKLKVFPHKAISVSGCFRSTEKVPVFCLCRMPEIDGLPMIECSICQEWFHIDVCIKVPANSLRNKAISRNQVHAGRRPVCTWFI